jgi:hypothetical protein
MNIFEFASGSPFLSFFLLSCICNTIYYIIKYIIRGFNIRKQGWPPEHCDADGDFKQEEE